MKSVYLTVWALAFMLACFCSGCFTSATAYTKKTSPDGTVTESKVKIVGTGDKASQIAAEGLFADGAAEDLGAGVKTASSSQQSTGIDGTLNGLGSLMGGMAQFMAAAQGFKAPVAAGDGGRGTGDGGRETGDGGRETEAALQTLTEPTYGTEGYGGVPAADGSGVYGRPSCSRCRSYRAAHPETQLINLDDAGNRAAFWSALRARGFTGAGAGLPVAVTADGYTVKAK